MNLKENLAKLDKDCSQINYLIKNDLICKQNINDKKVFVFSRYLENKKEVYED